ncbi:MAG: DEAD/DEAH box helicase, partial [Gemmatimonadota bacterium]|nr:DEAD/DEAH box helicase [Gemmatimonadota bacterium]
EKDKPSRPSRHQGRHKPRHRKPRHRGKRPELGGIAQRIDFPELLEVDIQSEEFLENGFRPLGLSDRIVLTLAANRFRTPTDIQHAVIPVALRGADIMGQAQTGTGKTIAFLMPIFERIEPAQPSSAQALIVVPTRELCRQVSWEARRFGRSLDIKVISLYGGTSVHQELQALEQGPQLVVGTPGRLLDHIFNHNLNLSTLKTLVLDEADRMFDIGFRQDIIKIIKACPPRRQIMLLSATLEGEVEIISRRYMRDPVPLYVSKDEISVESIWQRYIGVERHDKMEMLVRLLRSEKPTQSIIFTNTKRMSDAVALQLGKKGVKARCIHSDLNQNKRERIIDAFRTGKIEHLVATDVAARGIDITGISHVINYDIPDNPEDYLHRVGRTGRMGAAGKAFTFVTTNEGKQLNEVEKLIDKMMEEWEEA